MTVDEVFENVTVYIVTFPEGAGNAFMGFLQQFYLDQYEPPSISEETSWSGQFGTGIGIYNLFRQGFDESLVNPVARDEILVDGLPSLGQNCKRLWGSPGSVWTRYNGLNTSRYDERKKYIHYFAEVIASFYQHKTLNGDYGVIFYTHYYPYGIEGINKYFKNVQHLLSVKPTDLQTAVWCEHLKDIKKKNKAVELSATKIDEVEEKGKLVFRHYKDIEKYYPAKVQIDYNKFYFDYDDNEIEKLFTGTMDIEQFHEGKLHIMKDMIKQVTKCNINLTNQLKKYFSPEFQKVLAGAYNE